jgi:uridine phosphorylase
MRRCGGGVVRTAGLLEPLASGSGKVFETTSSRGFTVFTGLVHNVPVSIVSTGMGTPMMDFVVRETRAVVDGSMAIIRLGTCGLLDATTPVGTLVVASQGSVSSRPLSPGGSALNTQFYLTTE